VVGKMQRLNIQDQIAGNVRRTVALMLMFFVFVVIVSVFIGYVWIGNAFAGLIIGTIFSLVIGFIQYYTGDKLILALSRAKEAPYRDYAFLHETIEGLAIAAGLPKPKIYILPDLSINAFATGRDPKNASIAVTQGALNKLNRQELEGVLAHELSHIKNYDIRVMLVSSVLAGIVVLLADFFLRSLFYGGARNKEGNKGENVLFLIIGIILAILAPIFARLITLAISRNREYLADASGAFLTRYPAGLANALRKIKNDNLDTKTASGTTAHLYFSKPFRTASLTYLFSTHPPIDERIKRLDNM
jgi:heat shock protein HtpX